MAKIAADAGLAGLPFLTWSILGASMVLSANAALRRVLPPINRRTVEYFFVAALVTVAASNLIFFLAVPKVGVGFVSLAITLPPLLTYVGAIVLRMEAFSWLRATGVAAALAGAAYLALEKLASPSADITWIGLTLLGPVLLAIGNLYRSLRWPVGISAEALAPGMLCAATLLLIGVSFLPGFDLSVPSTTTTPLLLICGQTIVFAVQFSLLFMLQKAGGPVLLSLLGAVGAIVAVPFAVFLLGEDPPAGLLLGSLLIAVGIALVSAGTKRAAPPIQEKDTP
jgi:drug/metabolite transporter (DMT)-like permease